LRFDALALGLLFGLSLGLERAFKHGEQLDVGKLEVVAAFAVS
jgi:hypothetical protein